MKETRKLLEITSELMDHTLSLQGIAGHESHLGDGITTMTDKLRKIRLDLKKLEGVSADSPAKMPDNRAFASKIIPFPVPNALAAYRGSQNTRLYLNRNERFQASLLLAMPGESLPLGFFDFRPLLQRDGLILLAWDMRMTERGDRYTAYWVTSVGVSRYYASKPYSPEDFASARPNHKSYAAEDGIEFYGQDAPDYLVHVAPELLMSNPLHSELRQAHIEKLKYLGSGVDYNYKFLLKTEKSRNMSYKKQNLEGKAGA